MSNPARKMSGGGRDADVVIVGAGIIGLMSARLLRQQGANVIVVDRELPGRQATWSAGGMLSPLIESEDDDPFFHIADRSFDLYPALIEALRQEGGIDVDYRRTGKLQCALEDDGVMALRRLASSPRAGPYGLQLYSGDEARALHPALSDRVQAALFVERDYCVDNRLLARALIQNASACGVDVRVGADAEAILIEGGDARGVRLSSGEELRAAHVVVAAGAWSAQLTGLPRPLPVRPLRGQMLAFDARAAGTPAFEPAVGSEVCYLIPRSDGRLLVGATVEDVGFEDGPTPEGIAWLLDAATAVVPAVASLPIIETWANFRPGTPDGWPIIGADPTIAGLVYATGHYRNGILLGPVTAEAVAMIIGGTTPDWMNPFAISRFDGLSTPTVADPRCDLCGSKMLDRHCKLVCVQCGYQRDCSDP
ncbi:MAG: glycine oxidase ThiO [Longimicrobiales bacterium]